MMPRKITAIDSTLRDMSASVWSNVSCAFCSRWRILTDNSSMAPEASAWLASIALRNNSVRLASCSDSFARPSPQRRRPRVQSLQRHPLQIVVGEVDHDRNRLFDRLGVATGLLGRSARQRQVIGIGGDQHRGKRLAGLSKRRPDQGIAVSGRALDDRIKSGHVPGRGQDLVLIGLRNGRLDAAQFAEAVEEALGDVLKLLHRPRQHRVGRGARGQGAENASRSMRYLGEQFRAWLIDVAMDQVLQVAGLALEPRQDLVGLPHLPHVIPGRTEHLDAVPYQRDEHHDDRRVQRRDRQDTPADRHRADQRDDARMTPRGEARRPFGSFVVLASFQDQFSPPCEFVRSAARLQDRVALLRRLVPSPLRKACDRSWSRS